MRAPVLFGLFAVGIFACSPEADKQVMSPVVVGMLETTGPAYDDGQIQIYEVHEPVAMKMRRPNQDERPQGATDPYPRAPFQLASDTRVTVRFTLTNLEDKPHTVELLLDPWNEFVRYSPGVIVTNEETLPNFSGIQRPFVLGPKERVEGIITPDDMVEMATDLATAMKIQKTPPAQDSQFAGPILYNRAFNQQNRSSQYDVVLAPYIPPVVAGITGFDLGMRTYEPARVAVEIVIDIDDVAGNKVVKPDDEPNIRTYSDPPGTMLSPPAGAMTP